MMSLYRKCGSAKTRIVAYFMQIFIEDDLLVYSRVPNKLPAHPPPPKKKKQTVHHLILKYCLRLRKRKKQQQQQQQHQQKQKQSNEFQSSNETRSQPK